MRSRIQDELSAQEEGVLCGDECLGPQQAMIVMPVGKSGTSPQLRFNARLTLEYFFLKRVAVFARKRSVLTEARRLR